MNIDFDYKINDPNKILFLVKSLFNKDLSNDQFLSCDCFDESECHHLANHFNDTFDLNQNRTSSKCSFCQFYDYLNKNFTNLKINVDSTKSNTTKKHTINLRFKKRYYSSDMIEWCNIFTWKSPFALMAFASCQTDADIYACIKNYQKEKEKLKKTLICSKLFIDVHQKHEMSEEFNKTIRKNGTMTNPIIPSQPSIELDSIPTMDSGLLTQSSFENNPTNLGDNISLVHPNTSLSLVSESTQNTENSEPNQSDQIQINEDDLKKLLKSMENEIVYLDFIFASEIDDTFNALIETDKASISKAVAECTDAILSNFGKRVNEMSQNAEKQLNNFWNYVKTPIEKKNDGTETPRGLSISVLNENDVLGRLKKIKGDYYFLMNHLEQAVNYFTQACEKNGDTLWYSSAFESLYSSSYLYDKNKTKPNEDPLKGGENKQKLKKIAQLFKKSKEQSQILDSSNFYKNYMEILNHYLGRKETKIFALEAGLMITKFFMEKNMKNEALEILKQIIYISNVDLSEEEKVNRLNLKKFNLIVLIIKIRRYLEISLIYENFGMYHQAAFYKYISSGRIFRLIEKDPKIIRNCHFKCLLKRCIAILKSTFDTYKINEQSKGLLSEQVGFPQIKIRILLNVIKLYQYDSNVSESIKYIKYLIHEMNENLSNSSIEGYFETFMKLLEMKNINEIKDEPFYTKFFKFPILNSLNPIVCKSELNKSLKIQYSQTTNSIYIHRYQSQCTSNRKPKIFTLPADHLNKIEIFLTNPLPIPVKIKQLDLIAEETNESKLLIIINLVNFENPNEHEIILEPNSTNKKFNMAFNFKNIGTFRAIGYKISVFNCEDMIYFNEISKHNKNKYSISKCPSSVHSYFDLVMVPNLPIIKKISLFEQNDNLPTPAVGLFESKSLVIDTYLGTNKIFYMDFLLEYQVLDMEIINLKLSILNEQILENSRINVCLVKEEKACVKIDCEKFSYDVKADELELNSYLEIKYTNKVGYENNLCNLFKIQMLIKFTQAILAEIVDINDLNENEFELIIRVENLLLDKSIKCIFDENEIEIKSKVSSILKIKIKKFDIETLLESNDFNSSSVNNLNNFMNIYFKIESKKENFRILLSSRGTNLKQHLNKIYKFPFTLKSIVKSDTNSAISFKYCSLMLLAFNRPELKCMQNFFSFKANLKNKINNYFTTKKFTWIFNDLNSNYWCKEVKLIKNNDDTNLFEICFDLESLLTNEILKWSYCFSIENSLSYTPVK